MACCHSIVVDQRLKTYNASSPDELALVNAAKQFGYIFQDRDEDGNLMIRDDLAKKTLTYKLLSTCEFTSSRKRMSVIVRLPEENNRIMIMCKGADSAIDQLLIKPHTSGGGSQPAETPYSCISGFVDTVADEGLRTLYCAYAYLEEKDYQKWAIKK